ncbi:hypothetical protein SNE40_016164 [Patella caerulea]|uniref:Uncharacterized protein n=1 Tax=Patella caerulea TaxID=87958 RepID=A0AAN8PBQ3_PATCE
MPTVVRKKMSGSEGLEQGLRSLRKSKLMKMQAFKTLFQVIEKHQQDLKLAHITGKPKDLMENTEKDTKFFQIITNMLCDVLNRCEGKQQKLEVEKVFLWYKANKHNLHSGPRFGKENQKQEAQEAFKKLMSLGHFNMPQLSEADQLFTHHAPAPDCDSEDEFQVSKILNSCDDDFSQPGIDNFSQPGTDNFSQAGVDDLSSAGNSHSHSGIDLDLTTEVDYEEVLNRDSECGDSDQENMFIDVNRMGVQRAQTAYSSPVQFKGRKLQQPLSRGPQKMVHSIASLVNPHITTPEQADNSTTTSVKGSTKGQSVVFRPITAPNTRADMLMTWQAFNKERTYGQDIIGKMNFVGRSGTGLDIRYNAHESAEMPEQQTKQLIRELTKDGKKMKASKSPRGKESVLTSQTLEDFYETADKFYPLKVPKLTADVPRSPSGKTRTHTPATPLGRHLINVDRESPRDIPAVDIKLDTLVTMIDNVTDGMEQYKEKLIPPANHGFRRPAVSDLPTTPTPSLSPANFTMINQPMRHNTPIQPPSSAVHGTCVTPVAVNQLSSTPLPVTPLPGIDWRGKITPDPTRYKSKNKFGGHTYVKKSDRASSRSAGAVTAGHRPKTAPVNMKMKWKTEKENDMNERVLGQASSHMTTSVNQTALDDIMVIQHLLGDSASQDGSMFDYDMEFFRKMRRMNYSGVSSTNQQKEYLSLVASAARLGNESNRSVSAPVGLLHKPRVGVNIQERDERICQSPAAFSSIGEYEEQDINDVDEELKHLKEDSCLPGEQNEEDEDDGHHNIEICAIPPEGAGPVPEDKRSQPLQPLTVSDAWQFSPDLAFKAEVKRQPLLRSQSAQTPRSHISKVHHERLPQPPMSRKTLIKESYSIECLPQTPIARVERSAGRMPGKSNNAAIHLMQMAQRQRENLHKAPPIRTPPSIPSPYSSIGGRTPRCCPGRHVYQKELEDHARKTKSPRRFMEHVTELREGLHTAPASTNEEKHLMETLQVHQIQGHGDYPSSILKPHSAMPYAHYTDVRRPISGLDRQVTFGSTEHYPEKDGVDGEPRFNGEPGLMVTPDTTLRRQLEGDNYAKSKVTGQSSRLSTPGTTSKPGTPSISLVRVGRPIAQVQKIADPDEELQAANLLKQTAAAVDIQRIYRGYVDTSDYKMLKKEEREKLEDQQKAALEIQRHFRGHLARKASIYKRQLNVGNLEWAKQYKEVLMEKERQRQIKLQQVAKENTYNYVSAVNRIADIGPHVEIYQVYHPKHIGATKLELDSAAVMMQKLVRGWLVRRKLERLKRKSMWYGSEFPVMVKEYRNMLIRVQKHHGIEKYQTPFSIAEMNSYMDSRKRYESVFERRAFGGELEMGDVDQFFKECDLYPSQAEIEEAREIICRKPGQTLKKEKGISKRQILDMLYYIYVPTATGLQNKRISTWMNPIIDGQEAKKLIGSVQIEPAPLEICAELVIQAKKEAREREQALKLEKLKQEEEAEDK